MRKRVSQKRNSWSKDLSHQGLRQALSRERSRLLRVLRIRCCRWFLKILQNVRSITSLGCQSTGKGVYPRCRLALRRVRQWIGAMLLKDRKRRKRMWISLLRGKNCCKCNCQSGRCRLLMRRSYCLRRIWWYFRVFRNPYSIAEILQQFRILNLRKLFKNPRAKPDGIKMFCSAFLNDARMCCFFANAIVKY